jgi:hypothetical protein
MLMKLSSHSLVPDAPRQAWGGANIFDKFCLWISLHKLVFERKNLISTFSLHFRVSGLLIHMFVTHATLLRFLIL